MATIIKVDGTREPLKDLSLASLQKIVGGYIEIVPTNTGQLLVLDEEGKLKGKEVNPEGTRLTRGIVADDDFIVGDVILAKKSEIE